MTTIARGTTSRWRVPPRAAAVAAAACVLFVFTWMFRFNTLGGSFGGFANDHFVPFAYAKQVEAGEQPLRDFTGLGLQGAWPSLTYEISAAGQRLLGDNWRSEAIVTVTGTALAAAATCVAAALVAPIAWSIAASLGAVLLQPTLYNYPKVLVLSLFAVAACAHASRRSRATVAALAVLTAVAFLFRHDYAVYVGIGATTVIGAAAASWRSRGASLLVYGALLLALLTPSIVFVARYGGLVNYWRDSVVTATSEAARTELQWPRFTLSDNGGPLSWRQWATAPRNAEAWLYYLMLATPFVALALQRRPNNRSRSWHGAAITAMAVTLAVAHWCLLRGNIESRLGEVAPLWAVLSAASVSGVTARLSTAAWRRSTAVGVLTAGVVVMSAVSVLRVGDVAGQLRTAGMYKTEQTVKDQAVDVWEGLGRLPQAYSSEPHPAGIAAVAQYVNRCTAPGDRVMVEAYQPEVLALADRRFAGGRLNYVPGLLTDAAHQREIVGYLERQRPPLVLVEDRFQRVYERDLPIVQAYLHRTYEGGGVIPPHAERRLRVFIRRGTVVRSTFGPQALPCPR